MSECSEFYNCTNFDFGSKWNLVIPYLQTKEIEQLLRVTHHEIGLHSSFGVYTGGYKEDQAPGLKLTSCDAWITMIDTMRETAIENKDPRLPRKLIQQYKHALEQIPDIGDDDYGNVTKEQEQAAWDAHGKLQEVIDNFIGCNYAKDKTHIVHWCVANSCHWFNKYIGMYLAKLVCPDIKWRMLTTETHTTVISVDGKHMFDLLSWSWVYDRYKAYCCNEKYTEIDPSLGANESLRLLMRDTQVRFSSIMKRAYEFDPLKYLNAIAK